MQDCFSSHVSFLVLKLRSPHPETACAVLLGIGMYGRLPLLMGGGLLTGFPTFLWPA